MLTSLHVRLRLSLHLRIVPWWLLVQRLSAAVRHWLRNLQCVKRVADFWTAAAGDCACNGLQSRPVLAVLLLDAGKHLGEPGPAARDVTLRARTSAQCTGRDVSSRRRTVSCLTRTCRVRCLMQAGRLGSPVGGFMLPACTHQIRIFSGAALRNCWPLPPVHCNCRKQDCHRHCRGHGSSLHVEQRRTEMVDTLPGNSPI